MEMKNKKVYFDWDDVMSRCQEVVNLIKDNKLIKDIYGVPRGGLIPAVIISHFSKKPLTFNPHHKHTCIVDELTDSGATRLTFDNFNWFFVLVDKRYEKIDEWIVMPWECEE